MGNDIDDMIFGDDECLPSERWRKKGAKHEFALLPFFVGIISHISMIICFPVGILSPFQHHYSYAVGII